MIGDLIKIPCTPYRTRQYDVGKEDMCDGTVTSFRMRLFENELPERTSTAQSFTHEISPRKWVIIMPHFEPDKNGEGQ